MKVSETETDRIVRTLIEGFAAEKATEKAATAQGEEDEDGA